MLVLLEPEAEVSGDDVSVALTSGGNEASSLGNKTWHLQSHNADPETQSLLGSILLVLPYLNLQWEVNGKLVHIQHLSLLETVALDFHVELVNRMMY